MALIIRRPEVQDIMPCDEVARHTHELPHIQAATNMWSKGYSACVCRRSCTTTAKTDGQHACLLLRQQQGCKGDRVTHAVIGAPGGWAMPAARRRSAGPSPRRGRGRALIGNKRGELAQHTVEEAPRTRPTEANGQFDCLMHGGVGGNMRKQGELAGSQGESIPQPRFDLVSRAIHQRFEQCP